MFKNREGQRIPDVTFRMRRDHEWANVTSDDIFKGRTVVVFALPGAFTPTCSSTHVPRYDKLAHSISLTRITRHRSTFVNLPGT